MRIIRFSQGNTAGKFANNQEQNVFIGTQKYRPVVINLFHSNQRQLKLEGEHKLILCNRHLHHLPQIMRRIRVLQ